MAFDLNTWKERVGERLRDWKPRMQRAGINSVYAFLSAASLWPVVEAAKAGEWAALAALGGVLGAVGTNLLANRVQEWKDETDGARRLAAEVEGEPGLRDELDAVLERLEAVPVASEDLSEDDRRWFTGALREELGSLGNLGRYETALIKAESGGVAAEIITDSIVQTGDHSRVIRADRYIEADTYVEQEVQAKAPRGEDAQTKEERAFRRYLTQFRRHCNALPLGTLGGEEGVEEDVTLDQVYIAVDTTTDAPLTEQEKQERVGQIFDERGANRRLTALEAAVRARRGARGHAPGGGGERG